MENKEVKNETLRDEHLDALIRLAFRREEERTYQQLMEENQQEYTKEEAAQKDAIFARAMEKFAAQEKQRKKKERVLRLKRSVPRIINVAACLALIFCIAAPIAVARVEFIRVRVMKLLIEIQEDHARLSLVEDDESEVLVPPEWSGEYYPYYIPEGFEIKEVDARDCSISYVNSVGNELHFVERTAKWEMGVDTEDAELSYIEINGLTALLIEQDERYKLTWSDGKAYFLVITDLTKDECVRIASNVRIIK